MGTAGVGAGGQAAGGGSTQLTTPQCNDTGLLVSLVNGLNLALPVDYLGVYLNQGAGPATLYQSTGTPCAGAVEQAACQATLLSGAPLSGFPPFYLQNTTSPLPTYGYMFLAYTRGDSVGFVSDRTQLNALLGEVDTANEAGLVFLSMGIAAGCTEIWETGDIYYVTKILLGSPCAISPPGYSFSVTHAGQTTATQTGVATPCMGRRPAGLVESSENSVSPLGDYYASVAHLEAAAVLAFDIMERDLSRFGAPPDLLVRTRRARADEVRHASRMAEFALRWHAPVPCALAVPSSDRPLLAAALENAVEGCVREAWGALSAHYQAATAREPEAQRLWREIAVDESEHAELSFELHEWYMTQLESHERALVEAALGQARLQLRVELAFTPAPHPLVVLAAGVPDPACAAALFSELETQVFSA
ncbi:MAG: hypothetical protein ABW061_06265 [Polyangiaceae bacterium]